MTVFCRRLAIHYWKGVGIIRFALILFVGCMGSGAPDLIQPGTQSVRLPCMTPTEGQCASNADCPAELLSHKVASGETLRAVSRRYGVKQDIILEYSGLSHPAEVDFGMTLRIPMVFECAVGADGRSVCAKSDGMCATGAKCQTNEVCDMRFSHTDHRHLYRHGICVCPE